MVDTAIFVTRLVTEKVARTRDYVRYHEMRPAPAFTSDGAILALDADVKEKICPITQICMRGRDDVYIAYSEQVENLLGVPIRAIIKEQERATGESVRATAEAARLKERLGKISGLKFVGRLAFLFTKKLP